MHGPTFALRSWATAGFDLVCACETPTSRAQVKKVLERPTTKLHTRPELLLFFARFFGLTILGSPSSCSCFVGTQEKVLRPLDLPCTFIIRAKKNVFTSQGPPLSFVWYLSNMHLLEPGLTLLFTAHQEQKQTSKKLRSEIVLLAQPNVLVSC